MSAPIPHLRIALAQCNLLVGDIEGNARRVIGLAEQARAAGADAVAFPELTLTGYPPEDLLLRPGLYPRVENALKTIASTVPDIHIFVGYPHQADGLPFNSCAHLHQGRQLGRYDKQELPNYSVFDEKRYFAPGQSAYLAKIRGLRVGITLCEDIWTPAPAAQARAAGAQLLLNLNASPFHAGKWRQREQTLGERARETGLPVLYVNLVGGQDELVFDGGSLVVDGTGQLCQRAVEMREELLLVELDAQGAPLAGQPAEPLDETEATYNALVLGVQDYVTKNGFQGAVVGLSGGIDSALTLAIAADALGPEQVEAVLMPSRYTADMSVEDARAEAERLGVAHHSIAIEGVFNAFLDSLEPFLAGTEPDTTEENLQARCRGVLLMAISNKRGSIVLTTGNKSEMAVGYATLYGDMAGGFAPLKDVPKMLVYRLSEWRNREHEVIPRRVIERAPSAELAPDQEDQDSLPPYADLDRILELYVEQDHTPLRIIDEGFDEATVLRVVAMVNRNEYKRRQAAPGVRITERAFGRDRRYPITSGYARRNVRPPRVLKAE